MGMERSFHMLLLIHTGLFATLLLIKCAFAKEASASTKTNIHSPPIAPNAPNHNDDSGTCPFRVINYITDKLPQQCLKNSWTSSNVIGTNGASRMRAGDSDLKGLTTSSHKSSAIEEVLQHLSPNTAVEAKQSQEPVPGSIQDQSAFLTFEEWKKIALEKAELNHGQKKLNDAKRRDVENPQNSIDHPVDEGTVDLQLSLRSGYKKTLTEVKQMEANEATVPHTPTKKESYRSKDAGKTCKERFSYASFDAGATVLKTHSGAKNAKNVLTENKDSYMLSECSLENKFIIIELSEDIWIDTLVLANYEFFSSMIRTFRISVSDRYPVKIEKWKEVGIYEARNSREIQAFLVENPQIWARYIRIEFLDHYGTEYYCPLSLVRVHGTRMLESWKETEAAGEDEDVDEELALEEPNGTTEETVVEVTINKDSGELPLNEVPEASGTEDTLQLISRNTTSRKDPGFYIFKAGQTPSQGVCPLDKMGSQHIIVEVIETITINSTMEFLSGEKSNLSYVTNSEFKYSKKNDQETNTILEDDSNQAISSSLSHAGTSTIAFLETSQISNFSQGKSPPSASINNQILDNTRTPTNPKNKNYSQTISSPSPLPTIQESFFKAVSRRLTLLESNSTLSLAYISEATSHLHQAFSALARNISQAQISKTTDFLDAINRTVLTELRGFRQQYDEIWQSTVISLENQKDESRRETLAVSERLNILAQEVVWQRRMNMVQSVLLLICFGIAIFSRVSASSENLFFRPRSRVSLHSRQYDGDYLSEPSTPFPWHEVSDTPDQTPIRSQNYVRSPNIHHNHRNTYQIYPYEAMGQDISHNPATSYFEHISNSSPIPADTESNFSEEVSSYKPRTHTPTQTPPALVLSHNPRCPTSSPLAHPLTGLSETSNTGDDKNTLLDGAKRNPISLHLPDGFVRPPTYEKLTPPTRRRSLLRRRSFQTSGNRHMNRVVSEGSSAKPLPVLPGNLS